MNGYARAHDPDAGKRLSETEKNELWSLLETRGNA